MVTSRLRLADRSLTLLSAVIAAVVGAASAAAMLAIDRILALDASALLAVVGLGIPALGWYRENRRLQQRERELGAQNLRLDAAITELDRTRKFLDLVIDNVPATIIVKDAHDF